MKAKDSKKMIDEVKDELEDLRELEYRDNGLTRTLFNISLPEVVKALLLKDQQPPLLVSNSVRHREGKLSPNDRWGEILKQIREARGKIKEDLGKFMMDTVFYTRMDPEAAEDRKLVQGLMFYTKEKPDKIDTGYAYGWAEYHFRHSKGALNPNDAVAATFDVKNEFQIRMVADHIGETVMPICVLNSAIQRTLISYDFQRNDNLHIGARHFYLQPMGDVIKVLEISGGNDLKYEWLTEEDSLEGREIGEIKFEPTGSKFIIDVEAGQIADFLKKSLGD